MLTLALIAGCWSSRPLTAPEIVARVRDAYRWESAVATVRMTLDSSSAHQPREFDVRSRRTSTWSRTRIDVLHPTELEGSAFLLVDRAGSADDDLFVRLARSSLTFPLGPSLAGIADFMASDLKFSDLGVLGDFSGEAALVDGAPGTWALRTVAGAPYTHVRTTVRQADFAVTRLELFDGQELLKVVDVRSTEAAGRYLVPVEAEVLDLRRGTSTTLEVLSYHLDVKGDLLPNRLFTAASLGR
jgi:hypothetical protein